MLPLDDLLPECLDYLKSLGSTSTKLSEILSSKDSIVYGAIETAIHRVNQNAQSKSPDTNHHVTRHRESSVL